MQTEHPTNDVLAAFAAGKLPNQASEDLEAHLAGCDTCVDAIDHLTVFSNLVCHLHGQRGPIEPCEPSVLLWMEGLKSHNPFPSGTDDRDILDLLAPPAVPSDLGCIGRYRILGRIDAGGMGCIFRAFHPVMEREVALKVMARKLMDSSAAVARFQREVKALSRLNHPNIVTAYDADAAGDLHFLVMEYVEGTDLSRLVKTNGPLPVAQACDYIRQAALGLEHAHERGLIHRDIKPSNLLLTADGTTIKILDMGLARLLQPGAFQTSTDELTDTGLVMGTPDFVAPEQADDAHTADGRSDIYSLGCTFYFLLAGQPPFAGQTTLQKLRAHQDRPLKPLTEFRADVPTEVVAILERMTAKNPAERFQTAADVIKALSACVFPAPASSRSRLPSGTSEVVGPARQAGPTRHVFRLVVAAVILLVTSAGLGVTIWIWRGHRDPAERSLSGSAESQPDAQKPVGARATTPPPVGKDEPPFPNSPFPEGDPRDKAIAWMRENDNLGPRDSLIDRVVQNLEKSGPGRGFQISAGGSALKSGRATFLTGWSGEFFVSEVPAELSKELRINDGTPGGLHLLDPSVMVYNNGIRDKAVKSQRPIVRLDKIEIDDADHLDGRKGITGWVSFQRLDQQPGKYFLRLTILAARANFSSEYQLGRQIPAGDQPLRCFFAPINESRILHAGPLPVFLELCAHVDSDPPGQFVIVSNCIATLVNVTVAEEGNK